MKLCPSCGAEVLDYGSGSSVRCESCGGWFGRSELRYAPTTFITRLWVTIPRWVRGLLILILVVVAFGCFPYVAEQVDRHPTEFIIAWLVIPVILVGVKGSGIHKGLKVSHAAKLRTMCVWLAGILSLFLFGWAAGPPDFGYDLFEDPLAWILCWLFVISLVAVILITNKLGTQIIESTDQYKAFIRNRDRGTSDYADTEAE